MHRARGLPRAVEVVSELAGLRIQRGVVRGLVEPGGPDDHRGAVAVADHHVMHVLDHDVLPGRIADVSPAGRFFPDHQAQLVAGVEDRRPRQQRKCRDSGAADQRCLQQDAPGGLPAVLGVLRVVCGRHSRIPFVAISAQIRRKTVRHQDGRHHAPSPQPVPVPALVASAGGMLGGAGMMSVFVPRQTVVTRYVYDVGGNTAPTAPVTSLLPRVRHPGSRRMSGRAIFWSVQCEGTVASGDQPDRCPPLEGLNAPHDALDRQL